jgi:hypothetical protein
MPNHPGSMRKPPPDCLGGQLPGTIAAARRAGLVEVVEEKFDSRGGVAAKDLLH